MLEFILGIIIGIFITLFGIVIAAAAGPDNEFDDLLKFLDTPPEYRGDN